MGAADELGANLSLLAAQDDEWADEGGEFASGDKDLDFLSGRLRPPSSPHKPELTLRRFTDLLGRDGSLSKYLDGDSEDGEADTSEDEDLKDDPIYTLDIQVRFPSRTASPAR